MHVINCYYSVLVCSYTVTTSQKCKQNKNNMSITFPIIAMPHQMTEYKQIRHLLRIGLHKCLITITFHFGVDFNLWVSGYMTGPPGSAVEFGPYNISNRILYTWKLLLLWAVGLWVKKKKKSSPQSSFIKH